MEQSYFTAPVTSRWIKRAVRTGCVLRLLWYILPGAKVVNGTAADVFDTTVGSSICFINMMQGLSRVGAPGYYLTLFELLLLICLSGLVFAYPRRWVFIASGLFATFNLVSYLTTGINSNNPVLNGLEFYGFTTFIDYLSLGLLLVGLAALKQAPSVPPGRCKMCGYIVVGVPTNVCPECGSAFADGAPPTSSTKNVEKTSEVGINSSSDGVPPTLP